MEQNTTARHYQISNICVQRTRYSVSDIDGINQSQKGDGLDGACQKVPIVVVHDNGSESNGRCLSGDCGAEKCTTSTRRVGEGSR